MKNYVFFNISQVTLLRERIIVGNINFLTSNLYTVSDVTLEGDKKDGKKTVSLGFINLRNILETVMIHGDAKEVDGFLQQLKCFGLPDHNEFWHSREK